MRKSTTKQSTYSTYLAIAIGVLITASLVFIAFNYTYEQAKETSDSRTAIIKDNITRKINSIDEAIFGMRTLFDASSEVDADEFRLLSENLLKRHPYIESTIYLEKISSNKRETFELNMKDNGYINFTITELKNDKFIPANNKTTYYPVLYKEPFTPVNAKHLGFDYLSVNTFKTAINHAIESAQAITSAKIDGKKDEQKYAVFIAIYAGKTTPDTLAERQKTITGIIALHIDATKLAAADANYHINLSIKYNNSSPNTLLRYDYKPTISQNDWTLNFLHNKYQIITNGDTYALDVKTPLLWSKLDKTLISVAIIIGLIVTFLIFLQTKVIVNHNNELHYRNSKIKELVNARTKELAIEKEKAITTLESIADAVITTDAHGYINYLNPIAESITGWTRDEAYGLPIHEVFVIKNEQSHTPIEYSIVFECIKQATVVEIPGDVTIINKNNFHETSVEISTAPIKDTQNKIIGVVVVSHDVSDARRLAQEMTHLATHDDLTALPNRVLLNDRLTQAISRSPWNNKTLAVLFLDLDRFKLVNDTHGHNVGDELLKHVANRLLSCLRDGDTVSRLGGDEFVIVLTDLASTSDINSIADKIIQIFESPFELADEEFYSTASVGISVYPKDGKSALELMKKADIAMYRAKSLGKNNYVLYSDEMSKQDARVLKLETDLRHAIEREEFELHYQPQVDAKSKKIIGAEALIRWNNPNLGSISPLEFIPIAEETGLIIPIGQWVLKKAAEQCKNWQEIGLPDISVSVNISAIQFERGSIFNDVKRVLHHANLEPKYLELELTEGTLAKDPKSAVNTLNKLHDMGIKLSIDDFGTGYSSLSYLKQFCVSTLKIDRSFVKDIMTDPDDAAMCTAIISIAQNLHLHVVAEGVEDSDQLEFLINHNCNTIQGYYFSKPLPNDLFIEYLSRYKDQCEIISFQQLN